MQVFFSEGLAQVCINGKWGYIDSDGRMAIPAVYDMTEPFRNGLALVVQNGRWCYINRDRDTIWQEK